MLIRSYDLLELQLLRSELAARRINVYMSDEFTYAIPGLPGAEQPRALWVAEADDLEPARRIVADLVGQERLAQVEADEPKDRSGLSSTDGPRWGTLALISAVGLIIVLTLLIGGNR
ncbi:MAG: DUF2007 domain-containing protein [Burkholderiaceae bacterium]